MDVLGFISSMDEIFPVDRVYTWIMDTLHDTMHGYITCYKTEKLDAYLRSLSHGIVHILTSW